MNDSKIILFADFCEVVLMLNNEQLGRLFRAMIQQAQGQRVQVEDDLGMAWRYYQKTKERWNAFCEKQRANINKRWAKRIPNDTKSYQTIPNYTKPYQISPNTTKGTDTQSDKGGVKSGEFCDFSSRARKEEKEEIIYNNKINNKIIYNNKINNNINILSSFSSKERKEKEKKEISDVKAELLSHTKWVDRMRKEFAVDDIALAVECFVDFVFSNGKEEQLLEQSLRDNKQWFRLSARYWQERYKEAKREERERKRVEQEREQASAAPVVSFAKFLELHPEFAN